MSDPTLTETPAWLNAYSWGVAFLWTFLVLALAAWHHLGDQAAAWFASDAPAPVAMTVAGYGACWGLGLLGLASMRWRLRGRLIGEQRSERRAALLGFALDQAGQAAFLLDEQGRFQYANEASCRALEYSRDQLLNLSMADVDAATAGGWPNHWSELKTRRALLLESRHRTRTGRVFPVEIHASYLESDGRGYVLALTRDITERERRAKEAAAHQKVLEALFQTIPGFAFVLAEDGRFLRWNQRFQKLLGWSDEEMARLRALDTVSLGDQTRVAARLRDVLVRGESFAELTPVDRDGRERGRYYATGVRAEIEGKLHVVGVAIDISEQMAARAALHESEQTYREIFNATSDALLIHDETGRVLDANDQAYTLFGYDWKTTLRPSISDLDLGENPYSQTKAEEWVRRAIQKGPQVFEWRSKRRNGEPLWTEVALRASRIGGQLRVIAAVRDITARKQADEALREYQQTINAIVETSKDWIWALDLSGHHTYSNPAVEKILGYSPAEMRHTDMEKLIHPEDRWIVDSQWPDWIETRQGWNNLVVRWRCKDDSYRYLESTSVPVLGLDGELLGFRGVDRDITERVQVENALRASEARLNEAQRLAHVGTWEWDPASDSLLCSEEMFRILEIDPRRYSIRHQDLLDLVHPEDMERVRRGLAESMDFHTPYQIDHRLRFADGRVKHVYQQGETFSDTEGKPIRSIGTVQDITERKLAETALRESEARYRTLVELLPYGVQENDVTGRIRFANPVLERFQGYPPGSLVGRYIWDLLADDRERLRLRDYACFVAREQPPPQTYFTQNRRSDGKLIDVQVDWTYHRDENGQLQGFISVITDITQRKRAEILLKESTQRLQALSRRLLSVQEEERRMLARELHDDFGQQLAAFKLNLGLLSRSMSGEADQRRIADCLEIVNHLLERLRDIARDLRPSVLDDLGLAAALHWYTRRQAERSGCEIMVLDCFSRLSPEIETTVFRIAQEAVNNAIRHGGARHITVTAKAGGQGLALAIQDDGSGFDPAAASSKPDAGLGLNSMRERAELLDGRFALTSQAGVGTRIEVFIPLAEKNA
ncbi:MAG: PAS domain S-box protein [Candidatus Contendobacter sp.]|nr:PAS domain S-box protein [Candidatus Contendobacter sp.]MDG4556880.1 PAS domain S-box protein [Candidatus Contendobacter sp.]